MEIYEMTPDQLLEVMVEAGMKKYECSREEAVDCYQEMVPRNHFEACFKAAQSGIILKLEVLDSLHEFGRYRIFHDLPDYLKNWANSTGEFYVNPEARK